MSEEQLSSLDGWLTRNEWPAVLVKDLLAEIRALRKIKDAGGILLSSLCENHTDVHGMLELEASIADYESSETSNDSY